MSWAAKPRGTAHSSKEGYSFLAAAAWRREPSLIRGAVPGHLVAGFDCGKVARIVSGLPHMRVFVSDQAPAGAPSSRLVPAAYAAALLAQLMASAMRYTILLNAVESVDDDVLAVRARMGVPHHWREDDVVLTWSTRGSGIGYHAGHEDAIIVQAAGRRRWRVWGAAVVDAPSRRRILISAPGDNIALAATDAPALLDCELEPGDALYIPPFCPHQGVTLEDSISIALGWRGIAYFHLVGAFASLVASPGGLDAHDLPGPFFALLPDLDPARLDASRREVATTVVARLWELGCTIANPDVLVSRIVTILGGEVSTVA